MYYTPIGETVVKLARFLAGTLFATAAFCQNLNCDLNEYKPLEGLKAEMRDGALELSWAGCARPGTARGLRHCRRPAHGRRTCSA